MSASQTAAPQAASYQTDRAFFGHPRGLAFLASTECWVGFSYYGMQSLLVLYMTGQLLKPGHIEQIWGFEAFRSGLSLLYGPVSGQPLASAIVGLYGALAFATPLLGGLIADRLIGRTMSITLGCILLTIGHFLMAFEQSFLIALVCIVSGMGLAGVMKAQIGGLYAPADLRRGDAFQIYSLALQAAVIAAPIVCGFLGEKVAWHWGFGAAGVGMVFGLMVYLSSRKWLPPDPIARGAEKVVHPPMTAREWRTVAVLAAMVPVLGVAFIGNQEIFNGYLVWGKDNYQLNLLGQTMPVSWLLSMDAFVSVGTTLFVIWFWHWWARRWKEPDEIVKIAAFTFIAACAPLVLAFASLQAAGGHKIGLGWGLAFHLVNDIGFSGIYPIGMALFSRAAPPALGATVVNGFVFCVFICNLLVGKLAGMLASMPAPTFWTMHAALIAAAAVVLLVFAKLFRRTLAPETEADR